VITQERADKVWENAEVSKTGDDRYYVSNPKGSFLWAEVIVLAGGGLLVHGDCDTVLFGCHSKTPLSLMGGRATDNYVLEKAQIGTGKTFLKFDIDSARKEIEDLRPDLVESKVFSGLSPEEAVLFVEDVIDEFLMNCEDGQHVQGIQDLCDHFDGFDENFHAIGLVMDSHLFYAHAAVRKVWTWVRNDLVRSSLFGT
jgi:hypothetical protein